jgi:NAD(P)-dependent dehydrogenase (short-subunit alcohol dehydrogenase family)
MQGLGTDLRKDGIATLTLHPGWVRTDMGGSGADIDVSESSAGIVKLIDTLTISNSGRFMNYDGTERAW